MPRHPCIPTPRAPGDRRRPSAWYRDSVAGTGPGPPARRPRARISAPAAAGAPAQGASAAGRVSRGGGGEPLSGGVSQPTATWSVNMRLSIGSIIWLIVGVLIASAHHYLNNVSTLKPVISALLAIL